MGVCPLSDLHDEILCWREHLRSERLKEASSASNQGQLDE